jgi:uncharacterized protein
MRRLSESEDDAFLDKGGRLEESIKSVDYDVWVCASCDARIAVPYKSWTSSYRKCGVCARRTLEVKTETIRAATQLRGGLQRVTKHCLNCGFKSVEEESTPSLAAAARSGSSSSGGSSGGGSSFGGGSAGGGGAGRSY